MASLITGIFSLIGSTIKYTVGTSLFLGAVAIYTKPTEESFSPFFSNYVKGQTGNKVVGGFAAGIVNMITTTTFRDVVVARIAEVKYKEDNIFFVGCFNGWYTLPIDQSSTKIN